MWRIRRFALIFAASLLSACGGGGGDNGQQTTPAGTVPATPAATPAAPVKVNGAVQKGPFIVGSTVLINRLDKSGQATSQTILSEIKDSIGSFDFVSDAPGPVQIVATGYYFSELTGQISSGTLTLRALYELTDKAAQRAYVNLLTHLINHRALKLLSGGTLTMTEAIAQAESELLKAFNPALPVTGVKGFSELNIYGTESNVAPSLGSAYLLALSTAFYKYAEIEAERNGTALDAELSCRPQSEPRDDPRQSAETEPRRLSPRSECAGHLGVLEPMRRHSRLSVARYGSDTASRLYARDCRVRRKNLHVRGRCEVQLGDDSRDVRIRSCHQRVDCASADARRVF
jgi:hypothetical protein